MKFLPEIMKKARERRENKDYNDGLFYFSNEILMEDAAELIAVLQIRAEAERQAEAEAEQRREAERQARMGE